MSVSKSCLLAKALEDIIHRSNNGELGTSKVLDMRRIAEDALKAKAEHKPKVKPLEWADASWKGAPERRTTNTICHYSVFFRPDDSTWGAVRWKTSAYDDSEILGHHFADEDEAKSAVETHYSKLILEELQ